MLALWGVYSLVGGFAYGVVQRVPSPAGAAAVLAPVDDAGRRWPVPQWWLLALALLPAGALCAPTLAAAADAVSRLAPPRCAARRWALHGSAITVGLALGAPLAGCGDRR